MKARAQSPDRLILGQLFSKARRTIYTVVNWINKLRVSLPFTVLIETQI